MSDIVREKLVQIIARFGKDLCNDPPRCEALLRDLCGGYKREIFVLVSAVRERVVVDLLDTSHRIPTELVLAQHAKRLHENLGLAEDAARWAVESWALALGIAAVAMPAPRKPSEESSKPSKSDTRVRAFDSTVHASVEQTFRDTVRQALSQGKLTEQERARVNKLRKDMQIPFDVATRIVSEVKTEQVRHQTRKMTVQSIPLPAPALMPVIEVIWKGQTQVIGGEFEVDLDGRILGRGTASRPSRFRTVTTCGSHVVGVRIPLRQKRSYVLNVATSEIYRLELAYGILIGNFGKQCDVEIRPFPPGSPGHQNAVPTEIVEFTDLP